jgi:hypothetical protein
VEFILELEVNGSAAPDPPSCLVGLRVVVLFGLEGRFVGLVLPLSTGLTLLRDPFLIELLSASAEEGRGRRLLIEAIDALLGEVGRLDAREGVREELVKGLRGVVPGVEGRD